MAIYEVAIFEIIVRQNTYTPKLSAKRLTKLTALSVCAIFTEVISYAIYIVSVREFRK